MRYQLLLLCGVSTAILLVAVFFSLQSEIQAVSALSA